MRGTAAAPVRVLTALAAAALSTAPRAAEVEARPRRVLSIHAFEPGVPVDAAFTFGLRSGLPLGTEVALYSEHVDRIRFPDPAYEAGFREWLRVKYAQAPPDVVVAVGTDAVDFLADPDLTPFPGVPVVYGMVHEGVFDPRRHPSSFTGVTEYLAIRETLDLALALFPDTRHVALVGGASPFDARYNVLLRREIEAAGRPVDAIELFGLPMKDTLDRLHALPPRTVALVVSFTQDGAGRAWSGPQSAPAFSAASSAPLFAVLSHLLGTGITGGVLTDVAEDGEVVARTVIRVLHGERPEAIPVRRGGTDRALLDARQLARWGVPASRVPAGAEIRFREASLWERYRWVIVLAAAAFAVQTLLLGLLLLERRRRWRAEAKARENLAMVARMNRASALGELIASLAHEINSPLGAILSNAEAAQGSLSRRDEAEARACVDDIVHDATRAGEVIRRIAAVLRPEQVPAPLDLGASIRHALGLLDAVARDRGVAVDVEIAPALPRVDTDPVQLVQVVVNLVMNALDAVAGEPPSRRRIRVSAGSRGDGVALRVEDSGPGVPPADRARVFDPFFTTKPRGVGMGLSVSRSIVEAHGGSISVSDAKDGGAAFEVVLPAAEGARAGPTAKVLG